MRAAILKFTRLVALATTTGFVVFSAQTSTSAESVWAGDVPQSRTASSRSPCFFENAGWDDMTSSEQRAWTILGWNRATWDSDDNEAEPASEDKSWSELSSQERTALLTIGFSGDVWDRDDASCQSTESYSELDQSEEGFQIDENDE